MGWTKLPVAQALDFIKALVTDVEVIECSFGSDLNIRLRPPTVEQPQQPGELIDLSEHCARLSDLLGYPEVSAKRPYRKVRDETIDWMSASEWLRIASSIDCVEVDTTRFDESVAWCRPAWEYESQRSILLSQLATQLTVFNFAWGGFETITRLIDPPRVPKGVKPGRTSFVDEAAFYLKSHFEPMRLPAFYGAVLADFRETLDRISHYGNLSEEFRIQQFAGISGVGIHVVRRIRNRLAHGTMRMPVPERWSGTTPLDVELIGLSTRIVLLTVQMLLSTYFKDDHFTVDCPVDEWGVSSEEEIGVALRRLHVRPSAVDRNQLSLL